MHKILIILFFLLSLSAFAFAGSSTNYTILNDMFTAGSAQGLNSANYLANDIVGNSTGPGDFSSTNYSAEGGTHDYNDSTVWYLAEGCTRGFDTYVLIQNPNSTTAEIQATFMDADGNTAIVTQTINATERYTIHVNNVSGFENCDVSTTIISTNQVPVRVERAMYWDSGSLSWAGGHDSIGVTAPSTTWYLAEGNTNIFDEYVLFQNPNTATASVTATFMDADGNTQQVSFTLAGQRRYTIHVNNVENMNNRDVSTSVSSDVPINVERAMYWNSGDYSWCGGHDSIGVTAPATSWYLAEGNTARFDEYVLFLNPNTASASITATFMDADGNTQQVGFTLAGQRRYTVHVNNVDNMSNRDVSTSVASDIPIIVERSMYLNSGNLTWAGGHATVGIPLPATTWYLAEGNTNIFDEYVLFQNPNTATASITATFMDADGNTQQVSFTLEGQRRYTIHVNNVENMNNRDVSTTVSSDVAINVERAMYWNSGDYTWIGAHSSRGISQE